MCARDFAAHELGPRRLYVVVLPLIVGLILASLALDEALRPPLWAHALIWPVVVPLVIVGAMRLAKVAWLAHKFAGENR